MRMSVSPNNGQRQGELSRRIAGCRERLRRTRTTQRIEGRATTKVGARREALELGGAYRCDVREDDEAEVAEAVV